MDVDHITRRELRQHVGAIRATVVTESFVTSRTRGLIAHQTAGDALRADTTAQAAAQVRRWLEEYDRGILDRTAALGDKQHRLMAAAEQPLVQARGSNGSPTPVVESTDMHHFHVFNGFLNAHQAGVEYTSIFEYSSLSSKMVSAIIPICGRLCWSSS